MTTNLVVIQKALRIGSICGCGALEILLKFLKSEITEITLEVSKCVSVLLLTKAFTNKCSIARDSRILLAEGGHNILNASVASNELAIETEYLSGVVLTMNPTSELSSA